MASLLALSHELLHCVLIEVEPADFAALLQTCRDLHSYIKGNRLLHKDIFRKNWDSRNELDWEIALHRAVQLDKILLTKDVESKHHHLPFVANEIELMMRNCSVDSFNSLNIKKLSDHFRSESNVQAFLTGSGIFSGLSFDRPAYDQQGQQLSAKLHCLYGVPIDEISNSRSIAGLHQTLSPASCTRLRSQPYLVHTHARAKVYDLREYTPDSLWGPFLADGSHRVDWEKVEAILVVLGHNLRKHSEGVRGRRFPIVWTDPFVGASPDSFQDSTIDAISNSYTSDEESVSIRELTPNLDLLDPYGVSGTWMRVVCFLDYNELYNFNFRDRPNENAPRDPIDTEEGMLGIEERWQVTKIEPAGSYDEDSDEPDMDWSNFKGERLPIVHFTGVSRSLHNSWDPDANSKIRGRGTVRQTPEGEIRWTTFSIFHGEERWRSESIQVGGLRSARGVIGNWFDKDFDAHGPAGPTAFWKESNDVSDDKMRVYH